MELEAIPCPSYFGSKVACQAETNEQVIAGQDLRSIRRDQHLLDARHGTQAVPGASDDAVEIGKGQTAPLELRIGKNPHAVEPSNPFSSAGRVPPDRLKVPEQRWVNGSLPTLENAIISSILTVKMAAR